MTDSELIDPNRRLPSMMIHPIFMVLPSPESFQDIRIVFMIHT